MKDKFKKALEALQEYKGKKKFKQSVELAVNFRHVNFSKPENRINIKVPLPRGRGSKALKVAVFGDEAFIRDAKKAGADLGITKDEIDELSKNPKKLKKLVKEYTFLAQPQLMTEIAKKLGRILGPRGKMPKPLVGKMEGMIEAAKREVSLVTKGKYLPVLHALIGTEDMSIDDLAENAEAIYEKLKAKVGESAIKNMYVKLTMSPAIKV